MSTPSPPITRLLQDLQADRSRAGERLAEAVHGRLQRIAEREYRRRYGARNAALTIEPGALADDALMAVLAGEGSFEDRQKLFSYATRVIVNALIDYQRRHSAQRRGGGLIRVTLGAVREAPAFDVERLPPVLEQLQRLDARKAQVVELRVFWGMSVPEAAEFLRISPSTVDREWRFARNWIARRLEAEPDNCSDDAGKTT